MAASKKGAAPNKIHSYDASHMMLTILKMLDNGIIDFCMVHDSYACHAADAETMDGLIWEAFTEMYRKERKDITTSE